MKNIQTPLAFNNEIFRIKHGENMSGEKTIWIDLYGNSYSMAAGNVREATKFAKSLRDAANWIDEHKKFAFKKTSA